MKYHKVFLNLNRTPYSVFRNYSINCKANFVCRDLKNRDTFKPFLCTKRNISFEGIVKWQEQTYNSIASSGMVNYMQEGLLHFHDMSSLNWSATIILSTILVRATVTFPLAIYQNKILAKVENCGLELKEMVNELKRETAIAKKSFNLTDKQAFFLFKRSMKKQWRILIERDNCHPLKSTLIIWFQIPIWVCMSFALRNLVNMYPPDPTAIITAMELSVGGFGWIPNLTVPDTSYILPVAFGLSNLAIIEIQRMSKLREPSRMYNIFTNVFRVFTVVMIPVAASVPSCMCLYWTTSSIFGLTQNLCLLSPELRRKLKIPEAPSEIENPYTHIKDEICDTIQKTPIIASIYTAGRDQQNFSKPNCFIPYRWDRSDPRKKDLINHKTSAAIPFALGVRSCIGKKLAMLQLNEVIAQVVNNFELECTNSDVKAVTSQILMPDKKLHIILTARN